MENKKPEYLKLTTQEDKAVLVLPVKEFKSAYVDNDNRNVVHAGDSKWSIQETPEDVYKMLTE